MDDGAITTLMIPYEPPLRRLTAAFGRYVDEDLFSLGYLYCVDVLRRLPTAADPNPDPVVLSKVRGRLRHYVRGVFAHWNPLSAMTEAEVLALVESARRSTGSLEHALYPGHSSHMEPEREAVVRVTLQEGLALLSERQRTILLLHAAWRYSFEEIAERLPMRAEACRKSFERGRKLLRGFLEESLDAETTGTDAPRVRPTTPRPNVRMLEQVVHTPPEEKKP